MKKRKLRIIAEEILSLMKAEGFANSAMQERLLHMSQIESIDDTYAAETATSIVNYFLSDARYWRSKAFTPLREELRQQLRRRNVK